jgi:hypothetical protein
MPVLGQLRQEDNSFQDSLDYTKQKLSQKEKDVPQLLTDTIQKNHFELDLSVTSRAKIITEETEIPLNIRKPGTSGSRL